MKCPKCQSDNRGGVKFCEECGAKLELECPACKAKIPLDKKFCGECGQMLSTPSEPPPQELSLDEKIEKIQRYLPKGLTEKILSQRDRIEGERKQVTVMFCDMEGFTALSEKLGIEEAYVIMDQVYEILIHKVHEYEGTVNEMTGDGIMALFGAPIALEDAPQRAIRSSLAIHREMTKFTDKLRQEKENIPPIKMRIGIHSGPVVVGTLGNDLRVEFKAVGDTVNLASRVEGFARPGTTYVTEEAFKLTEGLFRFEALGGKHIKGKEEPVNIYQVIATSSRRTRFEVSAERGLAPFVGRERELEILLDGFERVRVARGQAFSIIAEAGIGKSRLLYEFRKAIVNENANFLEGKCLSYSRAVAYHPVIDILKSNFDIVENDRDTEIKMKVKKGLEILGVDETSTLPYLLELLSVKDSGIDQIQMSPEEKKNRINEALKQIVVKGSEIRPLIMAVEDLHWIDQSSEEVLKDLLNSISGARVFLLFTYRPDFVHTWGARSYHNQLNLNRLSNRESLVMASYHLGTEGLDKDLENLILGKAEGIPFFIEEFIRSLKDLEIVERRGNTCYLKKDISTITIPTSIQDVISSRVDKLADATKEVIQAGSVIEREFSYVLIKKVTAVTEQELLSHLSVLKNSELLYERGIYPDLTFIFKHALTREVIYDSILTKRKKKLHAAVGNAIEEVYKENISEYYGVLVAHFMHSEQYERAAEYSKLASKKALKAAAIMDAIEYTKKIIACLEKLPQTDEIQKRIIDARTKLGLNLLELNHFHEANKAIEPVVEIALNTDYEKRIPQIYTVIGSERFCVRENFKEAFDYLEKALSVSEKIKDITSIVYVNYWLGFALAANCEFGRAQHHLEQTLNFHVKRNSLPWIAVLKGLISHLVHYFKGDIYTAYQLSQNAVQTSEETGDIHSKLFAYSGHGVSLCAKGLFDEAENTLLKGLEYSEKANQLWWMAGCNLYLGDVYFFLGKYQKSQNHYLKAIDLLESAKMYPSFSNLSKIALTRTKVVAKDERIDIESMQTYASENKFEILHGMTKRYIAEIHLYSDSQHLLEAKEWIKQSIKVDKKNGMMHQLGQDYATYAEICKQQGQNGKAKENYGKAIQILNECGADGWVEKYENELAALQ
jgi:class 3 adenylate cyclase/tetratricopeptide (TPR) repeat protein